MAKFDVLNGRRQSYEAFDVFVEIHLAQRPGGRQNAPFDLNDVQPVD
jgi:hypothetical protein